MALVWGATLGGCSDDDFVVTHSPIVDATVATDVFGEVGLVLVRGDSGSVEGVCSGVLIAPRAVLTAAHCLAGGETFTFAMGNSLRNNEEVGAADEVQTTARVVPHPAFNHDTFFFGFDQALLWFDEPFRQAPATFGAQKPLPAHPVTVVGYGVAEPDAIDTGVGVRRFKSLVVQAPQLTRDARRYDGVYPGRYIDNYILAGPALAIEGTACRGDSGGALYVLGDTRRLVGIVSHGPQDCLSTGAYSELDTVWIQSQLEALEQEADVVVATSSESRRPRRFEVVEIDFEVANVGNAAQSDLVFTLVEPPGLAFVSATSPAGQLESRTWQLPALEPNASARLSVRFKAEAAGTFWPELRLHSARPGAQGERFAKARVVVDRLGPERPLFSAAGALALAVDGLAAGETNFGGRVNRGFLSRMHAGFTIQRPHPDAVLRRALLIVQGTGFQDDWWRMADMPVRAHVVRNVTTFQSTTRPQRLVVSDVTDGVRAQLDAPDDRVWLEGAALDTEALALFALFDLPGAAPRRFDLVLGPEPSFELRMPTAYDQSAGPFELGVGLVHVNQRFYDESVTLTVDGALTRGELGGSDDVPEGIDVGSSPLRVFTLGDDDDRRRGLVGNGELLDITPAAALGQVWASAHLELDRDAAAPADAYPDTFFAAYTWVPQTKAAVREAELLLVPVPGTSTGIQATLRVNGTPKPYARVTFSADTSDGRSVFAEQLTDAHGVAFADVPAAVVASVAGGQFRVRARFEDITGRVWEDVLTLQRPAPSPSGGSDELVFAGRPTETAPGSACRARAAAPGSAWLWACIWLACGAYRRSTYRT